MISSRFFYIPAVLAITSSCSSSLYDVWQGYEDIEPPPPQLQTTQVLRTQRGELEEVVQRASISNKTSHSQQIEREISDEQIQRIYDMAEEHSLRDLRSEYEIPASPSRIVQKRTPKAIIAEQPVVAEEQVVIVQEDAILHADELADADQYQPLVQVSDAVLGARLETIIIGEEEQETVSDSDAVVVSSVEEALQSFDDVEIITGNESEAALTFLVNQIGYNKGSNRLSSRDKKTLRSVVASYKETPAKVSVIGYAVAVKPNATVDESMELINLAQSRAQKVASALKDYGIKATDIDVSSQVIDFNSETISDGKGDITEIYFAY